MLFFMANLCSASELTLRFSRTKHNVKLRTEIILALFFVVCVILFSSAPKFAYEKINAPRNFTVSQGNCTDLSNDLSASQQDAVQDACPAFSSAFVQTSEKMAGQLFQDQPSMTKAAAVGEIAAGLFRIKDFLWLAVPYLDLKSDSTFEKYLIEEKCMELLVPIFCEVSYLRCTYSSCQSSQKGQSCSFDTALDGYAQCGVQQCSINGDCPELGTKNLRRTAVKVITELKEQLHVSFGARIKNLVSKDEGDLMLAVTDEAVKQGNATTTNTDKNKKEHCSTFWIDNEKKDQEEDDDAVLLGCNPKQRSVIASGSAVSYDSGHIFASLFLILSVFVGAVGKHRPVFEFSSSAERNARFISMLLGILASAFVFLGGQTYEKASLVESNSSATRINFQVWVFVYFAVSWMGMHHAMFMLVTTARSSSKKKPHSGKKIKKNNCLARLKMMKSLAFALKNGLTSSRSRWNLPFLFLKEIAENSVQLVGILNTALVADVGVVFGRSLLLSLNLIVLPIVAVFSNYKWGPLLARSTLITVETLFDKAFIVYGVLIQSNSGVDVSQDMWGQLFENAPSLLPAIMFCLSPRTSIITLAAMREDRLEAHRLRDAAARSIQRWLQRWSIQRRVRASTRVTIKQWSSFSSTLSSSTIAATTQTSCCDREWWKPGKWSLNQVIISIFNILSFCSGVALLIHVQTSIMSQHEDCAKKLGPIARCMAPQIYFRDNGFFGKTGCSFDSVEAANCSSGQMVSIFSDEDHVKMLPEAPELYANMSKLLLINVSDNVHLTTFPSSWSLIPNLARIDAAGCLSLSSIPFAVCRAPSSLDGTNGVNIQRTPVAKVLDWSNQSNVESWSIATACIVSWATSLTSLDISHNNISGFDLPQQFGFIQQLQQLSHLNVGHNRIGAIRPLILDIIRNVKHVDFHHNPIEVVHLSGESSDVAIRLLRSLGNTANCLSDLREVQMNGIKGNFTAVMEAFRGGFLTCYRASLTKIRLDDNSKSNFTSIAANFLGGLPNLKILSISGNWQLVSIKPKAFSGLSSLNTLYLTNNRLVSLDGAFIGMISLKGLFLYKNVLTSIDADAMEGLSSLKRLDLQENKISSIAQGAFSNMISLKTLHLWRNSKGPEYCPINSCNKALKEVNQSGWGLPAGASVSVL